VSAPGDLGAWLRLVVILDVAAARGRDLAELAGGCARGGATMLQVRAKALPAGALLDAVRRVLDAAPGVPVVVNDRLDVALAAGAAGCHLGQDDFPIGAARALVPPGFVLGGSAGNSEELGRCVSQAAHYAGVGPIRATPNKGDAGEAIGVAGFARLRAEAPALLVVAIGGVTAADVPALARAGATGIAVIGAVLGAPDPEAATRELFAALDEIRGPTGTH